MKKIKVVCENKMSFYVDSESLEPIGGHSFYDPYPYSLIGETKVISHSLSKII